MGYIKQNFANGQVLTEDALNHIEDGIVANEQVGIVNAGAIITIAEDTQVIAAEVKKLTDEVNVLAKDVTKTQLTPVDGTIIITDTEESRDIKVAIAPIEGNALIAVEGGLFVPVTGAALYTAGDGIGLIDNKISVKLANTTHGLSVVDGALTINLATKELDGAMSKEDKALLDSLPEELEEIHNTLETLNDSSTWREFNK